MDCDRDHEDDAERRGGRAEDGRAAVQDVEELAEARREAEAQALAEILVSKQEAVAASEPTARKSPCVENATESTMPPRLNTRAGPSSQRPHRARGTPVIAGKGSALGGTLAATAGVSQNSDTALLRPHILHLLHVMRT